MTKLKQLKKLKWHEKAALTALFVALVSTPLTGAYLEFAIEWVHDQLVEYGPVMNAVALVSLIAYVLIRIKLDGRVKVTNKRDRG